MFQYVSTSLYMHIKQPFIAPKPIKGAPGMQLGVMRGSCNKASSHHWKNDKDAFCHKSPFITNFTVRAAQ